MNNIALNTIYIQKNGEFKQVCPFPIGFIYMSAENVSPAEIYGGTWTQITDNKFWIPGVSYGTTGGSSTITTTNLPSHSHTLSSNGSAASAGSHGHNVYTKRGNFTIVSNGNTILACHSSNTGAIGPAWIGMEHAGAHTHSLSGKTDSAGSGTAYWQPYRTCYCWVRTA